MWDRYIIVDTYASYFQFDYVHDECVVATGETPTLALHNYSDSTIKEIKMTIDELRTQLEETSDHLVDAENDITDVGDMPEFTELHNLLAKMLDIVVDLQDKLETA